MEKTTFIKIDRNFTEWRFFKDGNIIKVFLYLLLSASIKKSGVGEVDIERGQTLTSMKSICDNTGVSSREARTCLEKLEKCGSIVKKSTNKYTLVTICNYDDYQGYYVDERQTNDKQTTNKRQTNDKQTTIYNNNNNINNINKENNDNKINPVSDKSEGISKNKKSKYSQSEIAMHNKCRAYFEDVYLRTRGIKYYWQGVDMVGVIGILNQIKYHVPFCTNEELETNFQAFIEKCANIREDFYFKNFKPQFLNSQFTAIYSNIKNGKNGKQQYNSIDYIRESFSDEELREIFGGNK